MAFNKALNKYLNKAKKMGQSIKQILKQIDRVIDSSKIPDHDSALTGKAGLALYQFYSGKILNDKSKLKKGGKLLNSIYSRLPDGNKTLTDHSLASGISGLCLALSILSEDGCIDFDIEQNVSNYDDYLISKSRDELANKKVDFLNQSLGVVYYFTTRMLTDKTKVVLENYVDDIISASIQDETGARFLNSSGPITGNIYDMSTAYGLSGILMILLKIYDLGIKQEEIKSFVLEGVKYILKFYIAKPNPNKEQSMFALGVDKNGEDAQYSNMLAWCYGDMNQLALLITVANTFQMDEWDRIIKNVTRSLCTRTFEESLVRDSHFSHGASGVAYLFQYLYDISGNEKFLTAKNTWLDTTMAQLSKDLKENIYKNKETQFLEGLVGVGFVLLSEISPERLAWSKLLLM